MWNLPPRSLFPAANLMDIPNNTQPLHRHTCSCTPSADPQLLVSGEMKLLSILTLALLWVAVQAAGRHGCCTAFSKVHAVNHIIKRGGAVQCRRQGITEGCTINAVVLKWKRHQVCVDSTPHEMRKLLATLCSNRKAHKGKSNRRLRRRKTKI